MPDSEWVLPEVKLANFSVHHTLEPARAVIHLGGNGDMAAIEPLGAYLKALHQTAVSRRYRSVQVDCTDLYFLNSSCLKAILTWIHTLGSSLPPPYGVHFITATSAPWQRRSLEAMRRLAPDIVTIA